MKEIKWIGILLTLLWANQNAMSNVCLQDGLTQQIQTAYINQDLKKVVFLYENADATGQAQLESNPTAIGMVSHAYGALGNRAKQEELTKRFMQAMAQDSDEDTRDTYRLQLEMQENAEKMAAQQQAKMDAYAAQNTGQMQSVQGQMGVEQQAMFNEYMKDLNQFSAEQILLMLDQLDLPAVTKLAIKKLAESGETADFLKIAALLNGASVEQVMGKE